MLINLAKTVSSCEVLGPGKRFVVWVQGCSFACKNCITKSMQTFEKKELVKITDLAEKILSVKNELEGITFLGGEPMEQAKGLFELSKIVKKQSNLSVMIYSGYTLEQIFEKKDTDKINLLGVSDIFIDGKYDENQATDLLWRGSSNQRLFCFGKRYKNFEKKWQNQSGRLLEFKLDEKNGLEILGIPEPDFFSKFGDKILEKGVKINFF